MIRLCGVETSIPTRQQYPSPPGRNASASSSSLVDGLSGVTRSLQAVLAQMLAIVWGMVSDSHSKVSQTGPSEPLSEHEHQTITVQRHGASPFAIATMGMGVPDIYAAGLWQKEAHLTSSAVVHKLTATRRSRQPSAPTPSRHPV